MTLGGNRYDLRELAGAFGDLGTLVPFVVGYVTITGLDPVGILVAFGVSLVGAGLYFRTPVPVQPMKAIATAAINHPATVTAGAISAANLFTAALWLVMGLTGAVTWLARITSRPVVHGIVLGLGLAFMLEGVRMMQTGLLLAVVAMALTFALLSAGRVPAMLVLLGLGALVAVAREPALLDELLTLGWRPGVPRVAPVRFPSSASSSCSADSSWRPAPRAATATRRIATSWSSPRPSPCGTWAQATWGDSCSGTPCAGDGCGCDAGSGRQV